MTMAEVGTLTKRFLRPAIAHGVGQGARSQSLKGILSAGPYKASWYVWLKIEKYAAVMTKRLKRLL